MIKDRLIEFNNAREGTAGECGGVMVSAAMNLA